MKERLKKYAPLKWYIASLILVGAISIAGIVYVVYVNFNFSETLIYTGSPPFTWGEDDGWGTNVVFYLVDAGFTWAMWLSMWMTFRTFKNNSTEDNRFLDKQVPVVGAVLFIYAVFCMAVFKGQVLRTFEEHPAPFMYEGGEVYVTSLFLPVIILGCLILDIGFWQVVYANKKRKQRKTEEALAEKTDNVEKQEIGG